MGELTGQKADVVGSKYMSAEHALSRIQPGSRVYLGTGCAAPRHLLTTLEKMSPGPADLEFVSFLTTLGFSEPDSTDHALPT
jgi:hypothetical protein